MKIKSPYLGDLGFDIFVDSIPCGRWFKGICLTGGWDSWILHGAKYEWFNWLFYRFCRTWMFAYLLIIFI